MGTQVPLRRIGRLRPFTPLRILALPALAAAAALAAPTAGCSDSDADSTCAGVTCSGHGHCASSAGAATCVCDPGYRPSGTDCVVDAETGDTGDATDADDGGAREDGTAGLILVSAYEVEIAVNIDAPADRSRVRFYGSLDPGGGGSVTGVQVTDFEVVSTAGTRTATEPGPPGGGALGDLPLIQQRILGWISPTAAELASCTGASPSLSRGTSGTDDLTIRLAGTSDQGAWEAETAVEGEDVLHTCHRGSSVMAFGMASLFPFAAPVGDSSDLYAIVDLRDAPDFETATLDSFVLAAEGTTETFTPPDPVGLPCDSSSPPRCARLQYQGPELVPDTLCPPFPGMPPELYYLYAGSLGGQPFAGAAPAGQCQNMIDGPSP